MSRPQGHPGSRGRRGPARQRHSSWWRTWPTSPGARCKRKSSRWSPRPRECGGRRRRNHGGRSVVPTRARPSSRTFVAIHELPGRSGAQPAGRHPHCGQSGSSNSNRLRELAWLGTEAYMVDDASELQQKQFEGKVRWAPWQAPRPRFSSSR
jgi:hypothetical protein